MIWPRSRTKTPSAERNQHSPAANRSCGTSKTGSQSRLAGTEPRIANRLTKKIASANTSVTTPEITRFTGSVSRGNTSFFTKLRCSMTMYGDLPTASAKGSHGSIPARKYNT